MQAFFLVFFSRCSLEQDLFDFKDCHDFYSCSYCVLFRTMPEQTNDDLTTKDTKKL